MKRPEGFDRPKPSDGGAPGRSVRGSARDKAKAQPQQPKSTQPKPTRTQGAQPQQKLSQRKQPQQKKSQRRPVAKTAPPRALSGEARAERRKLRQAARTRRRFEHSEIKRFTRRSRSRRLGWLIFSGTVLGLAGLIAVAVYSPLLALRTVQVDGASAVNSEDVRSAIDGQLGTPLALLDYDKIRQQLNAFPLIRSYVTEVVPPNTLVVHLVERAPVGTLARGAGFAIVDPAGVVLGTSAARVAGVPLITIGSSDVDSVAFRAVVEVLLALPQDIRSRVDTAGASSIDDVTLVLSDSHQRVVWGSAERSALKARVLTELLQSRGSAADVEYDVSAPLSPVVRG